MNSASDEEGESVPSLTIPIPLTPTARTDVDLDGWVDGTKVESKVLEVGLLDVGGLTRRPAPGNPPTLESFEVDVQPREGLGWTWRPAPGNLRKLEETVLAEVVTVVDDSG